MNKFAKAISALTLALAAILPAQSAFAHAELETSNPEANSVIGSAPKVVTLTFGEKLLVVDGEAQANQIEVTDSSNARVDNADYQVTGEVLTVSLKADLPDDTYKVTYRVVSTDGHPIEGVYEFDVNSMARTGEMSPMPAIDEPVPTAYQMDDQATSDNAAATGWYVAIGAVVIAAAMLFLFRRFRSR